MQPSVNLDANLKSDHVQVFVLKILLKILKLIPKDTKRGCLIKKYPKPTAWRFKLSSSKKVPATSAAMTIWSLSKFLPTIEVTKQSLPVRQATLMGQ